MKGNHNKIVLFIGFFNDVGDLQMKGNHNKAFLSRKFPDGVGDLQMKDKQIYLGDFLFI